MLKAIAIAIALFLAAQLPPPPIQDPGGYPAPAAATEPAPVFSVGDAPAVEDAPPTATPVTLPYDCVEAVGLGQACWPTATRTPGPAYP